MKEFLKHLKLHDYSKGTIDTYYYALKQWKERYKDFEMSRERLIDYKHWLMETMKPRSVNGRLNAINRYLEWLNKKELKLDGIKVQTCSFQDNVISQADYNYLKRQLKKDKDYEGYFLIRLLCGTGARVSEFIKIKIEDIKLGYFDIYGKGYKHRRIYIPSKIRHEIVTWLEKEGRNSGPLFISKKTGLGISKEIIKNKLFYYSDKYKIDRKVMHPHSFRHRFAKNFVEKEKDIALLADLMGHQSIETTRIYLKRTSTEQQDIVDKVVDW